VTSDKRISQFDKALMGLRSLLLNGDFPAMSRLPEVTLSERLGVSRTPLRQAMARLVDEGLLARIDTGGCRVVGFSMGDIIDAIEIRGVIEGTAARLAAERGVTEELLSECRHVLAHLDVAVSDPNSIDFNKYVHFNERFHNLVGKLSSSSVIANEVERASNLLLASPSAFLKGQELIPDFQASLIIAQSQHRSILNAIERREGSRAEALSREHARLARRNLEFVLQSKPNLISKVPGLALVAT